MIKTKENTYSELPVGVKAVMASICDVYGCYATLSHILDGLQGRAEEVMHEDPDLLQMVESMRLAVETYDEKFLANEQAKRLNTFNER